MYFTTIYAFPCLHHGGKMTALDTQQLSFDIPDQPFVADTYGLMPSKIRVKVCITCKLELPMSEFRGKLHGSARVVSNCKKCKVVKSAEWLSNNRERDRAGKRRRYAANPDSTLLAMQNQRAKKLGLPGRITVAQWEEVKSLYGNRCAYCGLTSLKLCVDHIWPLALASKGLEVSEFATNDMDNLVPTCTYCNQAKNDRPFILMLGWKNGLLS
jgi:5-methylcytosine-specific restriction endonuclease McrA